MANDLQNKIKFTSIICFVLFVLTLLLNSCTKEKRVKKDKSHQLTMITSDTIFDRKSPYYIFIQKNYPEALKDVLFFFKEKDIDLDGINEAVVAFSRDSDAGPFLENLYVLKNDNGVIKQIIVNLEMDKSSIDEVKIISMKGKKQSYIYFNLFEGPYREGFAIYELKDNILKKICISDSFAKDYSDYDDELIESNIKNEFDGYSQDVLYYFFNLRSLYTFENDVFKFKNKYYIVKDYPDTAIDVIIQYMSIKSLDYYDNTINNRLHELTLDNSDVLSKVNWNLAYKSAVYEDEALMIDEQIEDGAILTVDFLDPKKNMKYKLRFELEETNEKWQIKKIELL